MSIRPEVMSLPRAGFQVVFVQARTEKPAGHGHSVGIPIGLAQAPFIRARKFLRGPIDRDATDLLGYGVNDPSFQSAALRIRSRLDPGKHPVVDDDIQDNGAIRRVVAVDGVEDVTGIDRAPDDVAGFAFPRQQSYTRRMR